MSEARASVVDRESDLKSALNEVDTVKAELKKYVKRREKLLTQVWEKEQEVSILEGAFWNVALPE